MTTRVVRGIITAARWFGVPVASVSWSEAETATPALEEMITDRRPLEMLLRQRKWLSLGF